MNEREKNAKLLRELKTAISWQELSAYVKQLVIEYRDRIINKLRNFFSLSQEEKEILPKLPDEVLSQIKENVPPEAQEAIDHAVIEIVREPSEERKEEKEREELEKREELAKVSPEAAVLNKFAPEVYNYGLFFAELEGAHVDASINAFTYLKAMGFTRGMWEIGPEHLNCVGEKGRDCCRPHNEIDPNTPICQVLWNREFSLDQIINNARSYAEEHSFYPPKAIIGLSHPGCKCHISCWMPTNAEEIPDSAPGLPAFADPEELLYYKEQTLAKIRSFSQDGVSIPVDRWTALSADIYENIYTPEEVELEESLKEKWETTPLNWETPNAFQKNLRYIRAAEKWVEDIKPVIVRKGFIYKNISNLIRPIPDTYFGIQLERSEKKRKIFLSNMNYLIIVPDRNIEEVRIRAITSSKPEPHNFIKIDDTFGIIITVLPNNKIYCYLPEFNEKIFVDSGTIYEIA